MVHLNKNPSTIQTKGSTKMTSLLLIDGAILIVGSFILGWFHGENKPRTEGFLLLIIQTASFPITFKLLLVMDSSRAVQTDLGLLMQNALMVNLFVCLSIAFVIFVYFKPFWEDLNYMLFRNN